MLALENGKKIEPDFSLTFIYFLFHAKKEWLCHVFLYQESFSSLCLSLYIIILVSFFMNWKWKSPSFLAQDNNRQCCGACRSFDIKILDHHNQEVIHLYRPVRCSACIYPCCLQELEVTSPPGTPLGYVIQK